VTCLVCFHCSPLASLSLSVEARALCLQRRLSMKAQILNKLGLRGTGISTAATSSDLSLFSPSMSVVLVSAHAHCSPSGGPLKGFAVRSGVPDAAEPRLCCVTGKSPRAMSSEQHRTSMCLSRGRLLLHSCEFSQGLHGEALASGKRLCHRRPRDGSRTSMRTIDEMRLNRRSWSLFSAQL
jgi:hypothetical protein